MAVDLTQLARKSPYLFHLTYEPSLERIRRLNALESAARLLTLAGRSEMLRQRRTERLPLPIDNDTVVLTDQTPLNENKIRFEDGWTLADLVEAVNRRVFFWRGNEGGLLTADRGQFGRYSKTGAALVFLRVPFVDAIEAGSGRIPEFCKYNSGGARPNPKTGKPPRGDSTFVTATKAGFTVKDVREVTFLDSFQLPETTEICFGNCDGPWNSFKGQGS